MPDRARAAHLRTFRRCCGKIGGHFRRHLVIDTEPDVLPALLELAGDIWCQLDYFFAGSIRSAGVPVIKPSDQISDADRALLNLVASPADAATTRGPAAKVFKVFWTPA